MEDREIIESHSRQIELLTRIQSQQHELLSRIVSIQEEQASHLRGLADAIHHLAEQIGAAH